MIRLLPVLCIQLPSIVEDSVYFLRFLTVSMSNPLGYHQEILKRRDAKTRAGELVFRRHYSPSFRYITRRI
jgi:hypothetical protein